MNRLLVLAFAPALLFAEGRAIEPQATTVHNSSISLLQHPWDANAWEPGSGASFWHKTNQPKATGPATASASPSKPDSVKASPPDLSDRQSEK